LAFEVATASGSQFKKLPTTNCQTKASPVSGWPFFSIVCIGNRRHVVPGKGDRFRSWYISPLHTRGPEMSTIVVQQHKNFSHLRNSYGSLGAAKIMPIAGFLGCSVVAPEVAGWLIGASLAVALLVASWIDTKTRLIPNRLTYPLVLFGIGGNLAMSVFVNDDVAGVIGIEESLKGTAFCFSLMLLLFLSNATGGGDVKLATAIGAFLGPEAGIQAIAWCHLLAGVFVLIWMLSRIHFTQVKRTTWAYAKACFFMGRVQPIALNFGSVAHKRIPMAAFFALGVLVTQLGFRLW